MEGGGTETTVKAMVKNSHKDQQDSSVLVKDMKCKHEDPSSIPQNSCVKNQNQNKELGHSGCACVTSVLGKQGYQDSGLLRDSDSKSKVDCDTQ